MRVDPLAPGDAAAQHRLAGATVLATNWMAMLVATVHDVAPTAVVPPEFDPDRAPAYRTVLRRA